MPTVEDAVDTLSMNPYCRSEPGTRLVATQAGRLLAQGGPRSVARRAAVRKAAAIREKISSQSPNVVCRNRRRLGYQGVSSRFSSHRQSGEIERASHVGTCIAPARWTTLVQDVTTKSKLCMMAAVSMKGPDSVSSPSPNSSTSKLIANGFDLLRAKTFLQAKEAQARHRRQVTEMPQRQRALGVRVKLRAALPRDADLEPVIAGQSLLPLRDQVWPCVQIGRVTRNGFQGSSQHAGNAQQWDVAIIGWQRRGCPAQARRRSDSRPAGSGALRALEDNSRTPFLDWPGVANIESNRPSLARRPARSSGLPAAHHPTAVGQSSPGPGRDISNAIHIPASPRCKSPRSSQTMA